MAARSFKFVSPGVFIRELDRSQLPGIPQNVGPIIIGRTERGPAMKPVLCRNAQEFGTFFGSPLAGVASSNDPWRAGPGSSAPTYATYAANAFFNSSENTPVTMVRLLGVHGTGAGNEAGWEASRIWGQIVNHKPLDGADTSGNTRQHQT